MSVFLNLAVNNADMPTITTFQARDVHVNIYSMNVPFFCQIFTCRTRCRQIYVETFLTTMLIIGDSDYLISKREKGLNVLLML